MDSYWAEQVGMAGVLGESLTSARVRQDPGFYFLLNS